MNYLQNNHYVYFCVHKKNNFLQTLRLNEVHNGLESNPKLHSII
jgi:hypothetical protein